MTPAPAPSSTTPAVPAGRRRSRTFRTVLLAASVAVVSLVAPASAHVLPLPAAPVPVPVPALPEAPPLTPSEAELYAAVNAERALAGLPPLTSDPALVEVARAQAAEMAETTVLEHTADLGERVAGWQVLSENVGLGGSVDHVHDLLMESEPHRANILSPVTSLVGVAAVTDENGWVWVAQVFVQPF